MDSLNTIMNIWILSKAALSTIMDNRIVTIFSQWKADYKDYKPLAMDSMTYYTMAVKRLWLKFKFDQYISIRFMGDEMIQIVPLQEK